MKLIGFAEWFRFSNYVIIYVIFRNITFYVRIMLLIEGVVNVESLFSSSSKNYIK